ncbi:MAG: HAD family hydrolase [Bacteroidales bacterium]|nr:HAD family hydrolase [Bacteroidales bacterium]
MPKLIIFDLDGTLLNTLEDLADAANHILAAHGFPTHPVDAYRYFVGNGMTKLIERILPEGKKTPEFINPCLKEFLAYYTEHMHDKTTVYQGITEVLTQLQDRGVKLSVATNKVHEAVAPLMANLFPTIRWDALFGQRPGVPVKPDPAVVADILTATGCGVEDALYLGDSAVDMETAHRAGVRAVGVLWGYRPRTELENAGADIIIEKPEDLMKLVESNR